MVASTIPQLTTLVYALLYSRVNVGNGQLYTTHVALFPSRDVLCKPNLKMCRIDCDLADHGYTNVYDCNNVDICFFMCNQPLCGRRAIINATNAKSLKITQDSNANKCLLNATVISPSNGSAHLFSRSKNGFQYMNIYATSTDHSNTKEIIIDTTQAINNSKYLGMNVFAATSDYLRVDIGANLTWKSATVECPVDSPYNGSDPSPCMIDATHGTMDQITIVAPQGTPTNVIIEDCNHCNSVQLICKDVDALNGPDKGDRALYPWDITSDCWWPPTLSPSQTIQTTTSTSMKVIEASSDADITSDAGTFMSAPIAYYIVGGVLWGILLAMCCCLLYGRNKRHAQENVMDLSCQDTIADVEVQKIQRELCHSPKYVTVSPTTSLPGFFKRMSHVLAADESDDEKQP
eukprot:897897_1